MFRLVDLLAGCDECSESSRVDTALQHDRLS